MTPSAASVKTKYKLLSTAAADGEQQPCAFFASPQGCRSGENCRFAHTVVAQQQQQSTDVAIASKPRYTKSLQETVISSESEAEEEGVIAEEPMAKVKPSSAALPKVRFDPALSPFMTAEEAKMTKGKGKRAGEENPFANTASTKSSKKQKSSSAAAPPNTGTAVVATAAAATPVKSKKASTAPSNNSGTTDPQQKQHPKPATPHPKSKATKHSAAASAVPPEFGFRSLNLPIAAFSMPIASGGDDDTPAKSLATTSTEHQSAAVAAEKHPKEKPKPLPSSTASGRKWIDLVKKTRVNSHYKSQYDLSKYKAQDAEAGYANNTWIQTKPFDSSKADHPQVIAIDCEMCETQDPVSKKKDPRALCRVSVIDVETDEVLLDSLVKPMWPVTDYRTWVNGIKAEHLENVQFTLRHAQAFMMALCTNETVILGHAVHNDLAALRMDHETVADSACLFVAADSETAIVALRDLASQVVKTTMPEQHDSVNDARVAYQCLEFYRSKQGQVDAIQRTAKPSRPDYASKLFVHRIPKNACDAEQLSQMFLAHTTIQPVYVDDIIFAEGASGKTHVTFKSGPHGNLAFDSLDGKGVADASGRLQKKVYLKSGDYIRVRKMAYERITNSNKEGRGDGKPEAVERRLSS